MKNIIIFIIRGCCIFYSMCIYVIFSEKIPELPSAVEVGDDPTDAYIQLGTHFGFPQSDSGPRIFNIKTKSSRGKNDP